MKSKTVVEDEDYRLIAEFDTPATLTLTKYDEEACFWVNLWSLKTDAHTADTMVSHMQLYGMIPDYDLISGTV